MFARLVVFLLRLFYRIDVKDKDNFALAGDSALIVINVSSLLDPILVGTMLPHRVTTIIDRRIARKWWMWPIRKLTDTMEVDFTSRTSSLSLVRAIRERKYCTVFHGERFQNDPHFLRILEATGLIAEKAGAVLLPVRIDGTAYSHFSYSRYKVRLKWFPKVTMTVLPPQNLDYPPELPPRQRRRRTSVQLYKLMIGLLYKSSYIDNNILQQIIDTSVIYGRSYIIAEDQDRNTLTYGSLLTKVNVVGRALGRIFAGEDRVGFMLPSSLAGVVAFLGLHVTGKVPAMLNFTAGASPVISGCNTVQLKSILTARKFINAGDLTELETALKNAGFRIVYMEDVAAGLKLSEKIFGLLAAFFHRAPNTPARDPLAILFTSGTEGLPKAVFMSHRNANANREQLLSSVNIGSGDRFFNCLPMFHTFGLSVGTLLPLARGIRCILYPSPLHYRIVPQLFYETLGTVICGTDTFFAGYARYGRPYDFFNARLVIAGAEKMRDSTSRIWLEKYGVRMLEGYGATETSPVIAFNTPANNKYGSVGRILPGVSYQLKPFSGLAEGEGGDLWVKGDNVMLGYMRADKPGVLDPPRDPEQSSGSAAEGWYDTGDIVDVDPEEFVFIKGRAKRFAKVGGEMVSLAAVENALRDLWPDTHLGVIAVPDSRKGEQLILVIEEEQVNTSRIAAYFASKGFSPLWTPKRIMCVKHAPLLGAGKFDYLTAGKMAAQEMQAE